MDTLSTYIDINKFHKWVIANLRSAGYTKKKWVGQTRVDKNTFGNGVMDIHTHVYIGDRNTLPEPIDYIFEMIDSHGAVRVTRHGMDGKINHIWIEDCVDFVR